MSNMLFWENKLIKIEITIPLFYNDKTPIEQTKLDFIREYILAKFGGLTITKNQVGYWLNDESRLFIDNNETWTIIIPDKYEIGEYWITQLKAIIKSQLNQESVYIIKTKVDLI